MIRKITYWRILLLTIVWKLCCAYSRVTILANEIQDNDALDLTDTNKIIVSVIIKIT